MSQVTVKYEDGLKSSLMNPDEAAAYLNVVTNRKPTAFQPKCLTAQYWLTFGR